MVCSLVGARTHRIRRILYVQDCPKARVYEISPSRCFSRENARTLDLFALHFVRFSSRKSALPVCTAHDFLGGNLHVFRLESAGVVWGEKNPRAYELNASARYSTTSAVISPVCRRWCQGSKRGDNSKNFRANAGAASFLLLRV